MRQHILLHTDSKILGPNHHNQPLHQHQGILHRQRSLEWRHRPSCLSLTDSNCEGSHAFEEKNRYFRFICCQRCRFPAMLWSIRNLPVLNKCAAAHLEQRMCVVSVIRVGLLVDYLNHGSTDPTYYIPGGYMGYIEYNCAIVCACGVTYKPFLQCNFGFLRKNRSSSVPTTRFSRSVTSKKLTDPRSESFKTVRLMDDENEDEENPNNIELGVMSGPGWRSMPSTQCKNRDSGS